MSLKTQINDIIAWVQGRPTSETDVFLNAKDDFVSAFDPTKSALQIGSKLPSFTLPDAMGKQTNSSKLLAKGPLLICFYRGEWCPFCNLELRAYQKLLPKIKAKGVTFIAISPELPDVSLSTKEKHELEFTILSDVGNKYAYELGIVYEQPDNVRSAYRKNGTDLKPRNGDDSFAVPIPATILVDKKGMVRNLFLEADFFKRLEPEEAMRWIDAL